MTGPIDVALLVAGLLDRNGIDYAVGGSLASSALGEPRSTVDVDVAIGLDEERVDALLSDLRAAFYVPADSAVEAVRMSSSFNLLHDGGMKVDLFVLGDDPLDRWQLERRIELEVRPGALLWVTAPDVLILRKLDWFVEGGRVSESQWRDVIGVIAAQRASLDVGQLRRDAEQVGLGELVERALAEADRDLA